MGQGEGDGALRRTPEGAQRAPAPGFDEVGLVEWWLGAGHDALVRDAPSSWLKPDAAPVEPAARVVPTPHLPTAPKLAEDDFSGVATLDALRALAGRVPFSDGDPASGLMVMGEASSADDLRTLKPFTGPAGELLDRMLAAIGLDRSRCYITNLCPRRPMPGAPSADDVARDLPLTRAHIRLAKPRLLLLLGGTPAQTLLEDRTPIGKLRGTWRDLTVEGHRLAALPTFNPAYLLRRPADKRLAWADLLSFKARL